MEHNSVPKTCQKITTRRDIFGVLRVTWLLLLPPSDERVVPLSDNFCLANDN